MIRTFYFSIKKDTYSSTSTIEIYENAFLFRRVARHFWGHGRFLQIGANVLNSFERLNICKHYNELFFKNNYLCQIQIILVEARVHSFMIKRTLEASVFLSWKIKDVLYFCSYTIYYDFAFRKPSNSNNNKSKYILFLNALSKDQKANGTSSPSFDG